MPLPTSRRCEMSGANNILVDTNLIILALGGSAETRELLERANTFYLRHNGSGIAKHTFSKPG